MTRQEFLQEHGADFEPLFERGYDAVPCLCNDHCPGWQILNRAALPKADLWLDDLGPYDYPMSRDVPEGWLHVRNVEDAKRMFASHNVQRMSLDHDLGACTDCMGGRTAEQWLADCDGQSMPHCEHVGSGTSFVLWMAENDIWPAEKPSVHSANMVGRERMEALIERYYPHKEL